MVPSKVTVIRLEDQSLQVIEAMEKYYKLQRFCPSESGMHGS